MSDSLAPLGWDSSESWARYADSEPSYIGDFAIGKRVEKREAEGFGPLRPFNSRLLLDARCLDIETQVDGRRSARHFVRLLTQSG